jgi:hypothetical protein
MASVLMIGAGRGIGLGLVDVRGRWTVQATQNTTAATCSMAGVLAAMGPGRQWITWASAAESNRPSTGRGEHAGLDHLGIPPCRCLGAVVEHVRIRVDAMRRMSSGGSDSAMKPLYPGSFEFNVPDLLSPFDPPWGEGPET